MDETVTDKMYKLLSPEGQQEVQEKMKKFIRENKFSRTNMIISLVLCLFTFWMIIPLGFWIAIAIVSYQRSKPEWLAEKYEMVVTEVFNKEVALNLINGGKTNDV